MRTVVMGLFISTLLAILTAPGSASAAPGTHPDDSVRSDLRSAATLMETFLTDEGHYPGPDDVIYNGKRMLTLGSMSLKLGFGNRLQTIQLTKSGDTSFCLKFRRAEGVSATTKNWRWTTGHGIGTGVCPSRFGTVVYPASE